MVRTSLMPMPRSSRGDVSKSTAIRKEKIGELGGRTVGKEREHGKPN